VGIGNATHLGVVVPDGVHEALLGRGLGALLGNNIGVGRHHEPRGSGANGLNLGRRLDGGTGHGGALEAERPDGAGTYEQDSKSSHGACLALDFVGRLHLEVTATGDWVTLFLAKLTPFPHETTIASASFS